MNSRREFQNSRKFNLLLFEDNKNDTLYLLKLLKRIEYTSIKIDQVESIADGLTKIENWHYDLVLFDFNLLDHKDLVTFKKVSEKINTVPIIVLSEKDESELAIQAVKAGAQDYLVKGRVNAYHLERALYHAIERHKLLVELKEAKEKEKQRALFDYLTNLPNRKLLQDRLMQEIRSCERDKKSFAILFIDLDNFKDINDSQGHDAGDHVLITIARRLERCVRQSETVSRLAGDEFVVILRGIQTKEVHINKILMQLMGSILNPVSYKGMEHRVSASIGVSIYPADGGDADTLLKNADIAMYKSKASGKNTFRFFNKGMQEELQDRLDLSNTLEHAIEKNELRLEYQPIYNMCNEKILGFEAFIRWNHPEKGLIPPKIFITIAEETGLIIPLGRWILNRVCKDVKYWKRYADPDWKVSVNLSSFQLNYPYLISDFTNIFNETQVDPRDFGVEFNETNSLLRNGISWHKLHALHDMGIELTFDDFGTGYASLNYLRIIPVSCVKIDKSFICNLINKKEDQVLVKSIISMAHLLGLRVIAEGVEKKNQWDFLQDLSCDAMQGYYKSVPLPLDDVVHLLKSRRAS